MKPVTMIATLFLPIVAVAHLLRLALRVEVIVGGILVPLWVSAIACVVPAGFGIDRSPRLRL